MEDIRVNRAELSLLVTKTPQAGDINANFAELKADINGQTPVDIFINSFGH
jgi:hypothetical protein